LKIGESTKIAPKLIDVNVKKFSRLKSFSCYLN